MSTVINAHKKFFIRLSIRNIVMYIVLTFLALLALYPIIFPILSSFKTKTEFVTNKLSLPNSLYLGNFDYVLNYARLFRYVGNSIIFVVGGTSLYLFLVITSGYAFGQLKYKFKSQFFMIVLFLMIFPQMLLAIPIYKLVIKMGFVNTLFGAIIACTAYFAPYGCYIMTTYFASIPQSIRESAKIDGANSFRILWNIMMPIGLPMVATVSIVAFNSFWNELPFSVLLLQKNTIKTIILGVALMRGEYGIPVPTLSAAIVIAMIIPLSVFLFFQKEVAGGATIGAIKG